MTDKNMELWNQVCETNPETTKKFQQRGMRISICAQTQKKRATELWGPYGSTWGLKNCKYGYVKIATPEGEKVIELFIEAVFYYPGGEFEISSDTSYTPGENSRKGLRTDVMTKALSDLGFNSDVFENKFKDNDYINMMKQKFSAEIETANTTKFQVPNNIDTAISENTTKGVKLFGEKEWREWHTEILQTLFGGDSLNVLTTQDDKMEFYKLQAIKLETKKEQV